jgi:very-short-patch-repair endonuclease
MSSASLKMSLNTKRHLVPIAKQICRKLRRRSTRAEQTFWGAVRNRRFMGRKFYRQYPIFYDYLGTESFFVVDFYCHEERLVVEIDGAVHEGMADRDAQRTQLIEYSGIRVVRFKNEEIEERMDVVAKKLQGFMERS